MFVTAKRALSKALSRRMILRSGAAAVAGGVGAAALAACGEAEVVEKTVTVTVTEVKEVVKEVPVETVVTKEVIKEVPVETVVTKEVIKEVPVVEVKEVEVEKVVTQEKVVEVEVEKVVEREKVVEVMVENPKADSLVIGTPQTQKVDDLDGSQVYEFQTKIAAFCTSESLLLYDYQTQTLKPRLAESWEVAPDATSVTFTLREGVTWHNGDPFTPEDVVFNFNRIFRDDDPYHAEGTFYYNGFAQPFYGDTEVLDGRTVRVNLTQPDALAAEKFGALDSSYMAHPPSVMEHGNREYSTDPDKYVGTGPYIPVEVRPAELVRMVRNENWWGPKPDFKELIFRIFPRGAAGTDARVNALLAGEIDVALYTPATRRNDLFRTPGIGAKWVPQLRAGVLLHQPHVPAVRGQPGAAGRGAVVRPRQLPRGHRGPDRGSLGQVLVPRLAVSERCRRAGLRPGAGRVVDAGRRLLQGRRRRVGQWRPAGRVQDPVPGRPGRTA